MTSLKQRFLSGVMWQAGVKMLSQGFSFLVSIMLARFILPEEYGLIGMAMVFTGFLNLINEIGIGSSIIREPKVSDSALRSAYGFALAVSAVLCGLAQILAPAVAGFFDSERVEPIIRVLAISFFFGGMRAVPWSLLAKEMRFSVISKAEALTVILGGITSLVLAVMGFGVWALVTGFMLQQGLMALLANMLSPRKVLPSWRLGQALDLASFGVKVMLIRVLWYTYSNADFFIIGKLLGDKLLGFYSLAFKIALLPTEKITAIINPVCLPAFSELQNDTSSLAKYLSHLTMYLSIITFPVAFGIFAVADDFVLLFLTEQWLPIIIPLKLLSIIGLVRSIAILFPPILLARNKTAFLVYYNILLTIVMLAAFWIGASLHGINGVAAGWAIAYPVVALTLMYATCREIGLPLLRYAATLLPATLGSLLMTAFIIALRRSSDCPLTWGFFLVECSAGALCYAGFMILFQRRRFFELRRALFKRPAQAGAAT
ncbi:lipopolysaccharide biosynthesis protein [Desulfocurvibacter africanus]|uniref:lipopolysaccharide biosynthesis protein n=1 Tax=Desulfocurvibacter africanus TaxID=873 RepID=UPI00110C491A|nr:lipopolysaccharide biosynthesis protein [Desulfocurvibacter africanus]